MKNIKFKKKKSFPKWAIAVICVVLSAVMVAIGFVLVKNLANKDDKPVENPDWEFSTEGFENISDIRSLNGVMAVFTDKESGKQGLMTFDGKITEKAEHNKFSVCSDSWRNYRYIVESPRSEYLLLADAESGTVTSRQYHGLTQPEQIPCWNSTVKHLAWTDEKGYAGEVKTGEMKLGTGLYPVSDSLKQGAKYGYIGRSLQLEIALLYENAMDFSDGLAAVKKDGKWGYISEKGVTVIPFEFDSCADADAMSQDCAFAFKNGFAPVCKNGKFGIINKKAEAVVDFVFDKILCGNGGIFLGCKDGRWGIIKLDTKIMASVTTTAAPVNQQTDGTTLAKGKYMIKTSGSVLNMRADADPNSSVVAKIPNGTVLDVTRAVTGWAYVKYNSFSGWVSADFLVKYVEPSAAISSQTAQNSTTPQTNV